MTPAGAFLRAHAEDLTRNIYRLRQETLEVAGREASAISIAATHALSFVFFPDWIRSHPQFATLGPLNLISDTMEACEQIMARGDADFMLCHYHRDAMPRLEASQFTSVVMAAMCCCRSVPRSEMARRNGRCPEIRRLRRACCRTGRNPASVGS